MEASNRNRTLALAAMFQSAVLVKELAWQGRCDLDPLQTLVSSLFAFEAESLEAVYGGVEHLERGLRTLVEQMDAPSGRIDGEISRYLINLMDLERRLMKQPDMTRTLRQGIEVAQSQSEVFGLTHENVMARLGQTYQDSISQLGPRILVQGEQTHLSNQDTAARIRTALLGGIRGAVLWRQAGGSRWRLLLGRNALVQEARGMLEHIVDD